MYFYDKTKKEMLRNLREINWYLDIEGPGVEIDVIPMTWYEKWKPSNGSGYMTAYRNPDRKGYMITLEGEVLVDKLSPYKTYQAIGDMAWRIGNGQDYLEKDIKRFFGGYKPW